MESNCGKQEDIHLKPNDSSMFTSELCIASYCIPGL